MPSLRILSLAVLALLFLAPLASPAAALTHSSSVAYVTDSTADTGCRIFGGSGGVEDGSFPGCSIFTNAITGSPIANGGTYTPAGGSPTTFTDVSVSTIDASGLSAISGFDTVILYEVCDIGSSANANLLSALNTYLANGMGKVIIFDGDYCASDEGGTPDYSGFLFPFASNNPGPVGDAGTLTFVESESSPATLTSGETTGVKGPGGYGGNDAVGDSNTFTSNTGGWCEAVGGTNSNDVNGIQIGYARTSNGGLAIYIGWDFGFTWADSIVFAFDKQIFDNALNQPFNPDSLPCGVPVTGIKLDPLTATNPVGSTHTVTATVTDSTGAAIPGVTVTFTVTSGPNAGTTGTGTSPTDATGQASFTYTDTGGAGTDTIVATFHDAAGGLHTSNTVAKIWQNVVSGVPEFPLGSLLMIAAVLPAIVLLRRRSSAAPIGR